MAAEPLDVFISYATPDRAWATWVAAQAEAAGLTVELDAWDWGVGSNFVLRMSDALTRAKRVVALLSEAYFEAHRFTREEWTAVVAMDRAGESRLRPLRVTELPRQSIPAVLRPLVTADLFGVEEPVARRILLAALGLRRDEERPEPVFPGAAPDASAGTAVPAAPAVPAGTAVPAAPAESAGAAVPAFPTSAGPPAGPAGSATSAESAGQAEAAVPAGPVALTAHPDAGAAGPAATGPGAPAGVYPTGGRIKSSPAVTGELVLVGSGDGRLHAVDRRTMAAVWATPLNAGPVHASPVVDGERVYVGARDGVHVLLVATGEEAGVFLKGEAVCTRPVAADGTLYVATETGRLVAVDRERPAERRWTWDHERGGDLVVRHFVPSSSPCLSGGTLFTGTPRGELAAVEAATGRTRWVRRIGASVSSTPAVTGGTVYVGSDDRRLWALDAEDGGTRWRYETGGPVLSSPAVSAGTVFVGSNDGSVHAVDAATGTGRWIHPTGRGVLSTPLVVSDTVHVTAYDGRLYALDAATGRVLWDFTARGPLISSPVAARGVVYAGSLDGRLYAVHL